MALVGPRPALWNQYDLLVEREQYGANSVRPGLTGMGHRIHGRDGGCRSGKKLNWMDIMCTISS